MDTSCAQPPVRHRPASEHRRAVGLLALATAIGSLGLAAGGTAAALLAVAMTGSEAAAGLPLGALAGGQAGAALLVGWVSARAGRGAGLTLGYVLGGLGALVVVGATVGDDLTILLAGSLLLGGANAAIFLTRYAAADLGGPEGRGRALGTVLSASTVGTIAGPGLLVPSGRLAEALGLPQLTGLYLVAVAAFAAAALVLVGLTRSRLPDLGRGSRFASADPAARRALPQGRLAAALGQPPVRAALLVLGATNLVMVAIMAVSPVLLTSHGHHLGFVGLAITVHVAGMFVPSPLTGWLADRLGGRSVAWAGAGLFGLAGVGGAVTDPADGAAMLAVLAVLGLGWNCGVVAGSALLAAAVPTDLRPRSEAVGEAAMGLAAAAGAPAAGLLVALGGFTTLCLAGAAIGVAILGRARPSPADVG
jgi:MFS family permease